MPSNRAGSAPPRWMSSKVSRSSHARFLALGNVLLQPHHGSGTVETRKAMGQLLRDNLMAHFAGRPLPTPVL